MRPRKRNNSFPFSKEYLQEGLDLEELRRQQPYDAEGKCYIEANQKYIDWLVLHGRLLIEQAMNNARNER